jgi:hypothetical protein
MCLFLLWHVDPLLGNNRKINIQQPLLSNGITNKRVSTATIGYSNRGTLSIQSVLRCYKRDSVECRGAAEFRPVPHIVQSIRVYK